MPCPTCHGSGLVPPERSLELLAFCGSEAARVLLYGDPPIMQGAPATWGTIDNSPFTDWLTGLSSFGQMPMVCAAVTCGWGAFDGMEWETCCDGRDCTCRGMPIDEEWHLIRAALTAASRWCVDPSEEAALAWRAAAVRIDGASVPVTLWVPTPRLDPAAAIQAAAHELCGTGCHQGECPSDHSGARDTISRALRSWVLGDDPLRERLG